MAPLRSNLVFDSQAMMHHGMANRLVFVHQAMMQHGEQLVFQAPALQGCLKAGMVAKKAPHNDRLLLAKQVLVAFNDHFQET